MTRSGGAGSHHRRGCDRPTADGAACRPTPSRDGQRQQRDDHQREEPDDVEVEPVGERRAGTRSGRPRRAPRPRPMPRRRGNERDRERQRDGSALDQVLLDAEAAPQAPDRERRRARRLVRDRVAPERARGRRSSSTGEHRDRHGQRERDHVDARSSAGRRRRADAAQEQRRERERRELGQPGERADTPRAGGELITSSVRTSSSATSESLVFERQREQRERIGRPRVGEHDPERRARGPGGRARTARASSAGRRRSRRRGRRAGRPTRRSSRRSRGTGRRRSS